MAKAKAKAKAKANLFGFKGLVGKRITLFCVNYIYTGDLVAVSPEEVCMENAAIVYETGAFNESNWKDAQALPHAVYVRTSAVESYMILK
jgi:hypothetical protein